MVVYLEWGNRRLFFSIYFRSVGSGITGLGGLNDLSEKNEQMLVLQRGNEISHFLITLFNDELQN